MLHNVNVSLSAAAESVPGGSMTVSVFPTRESTMVRVTACVCVSVCVSVVDIGE